MSLFSYFWVHTPCDMVKLKLETKKLEIVCAYGQACRSIYVVKVEMFCTINLHDGKRKARKNTNSLNNNKKRY